MNRNIRTATLTTLAVSALLVTRPAWAQIVYSDTFDSGTSQGTASPYFSNTGQNNGLVIKTSKPIYNSDAITADVSGPGFFLFNGTGSVPTPAGENAAYISPNFTVAPNTDYTVSFFLTNDNTTLPARIQAVINGTALGPAVTAAGEYQTDGWQQFSFAFNSGATTNAALTLNDLNTGAGGNDFGLDVIQVNTVTAVPEPGSIALFVGLGVTGAGFLVRKRRKQAA